jgi:hypothetical protein
MVRVERKKKASRANPIIYAGLLGCVSFTYGFSNANPLFVWMLPLALVAVGAAWAFRPRSTGDGSTAKNG